MASVLTTNSQDEMTPVSINEPARTPRTTSHRNYIKDVLKDENRDMHLQGEANVPSEENVQRDVQGQQGENEIRDPSSTNFHYIFESLTPENRRGDLKYQSVENKMKKIQIKSDLVMWLIGSEQNGTLQSPYGRRLVKEILELVADSGSLLLCQGTNSFFDCIRAPFGNPKMSSAKKNYKVLLCKNKTDKYSPLMKTSRTPNEEHAKFQCAILFEGGDVTYREMVQKIPNYVTVIVVKNMLETVQSPNNGSVLDLQQKYADKEFSIGKFIFQELLKKESSNKRKENQDMVLLSIYLNEMELIPVINFKSDYQEENNSSDDLNWLREATYLAVRIYRQNCLTILCQQGMDFIRYLTKPNIMEHLKTGSWCGQLISRENVFSIQTIHLEMQRQVERIVGKHYFHKKEIKFTKAEVLFVDAVLENKLEASVLYWTLVRHPVPAALVAYGLFKDMKRREKGDTTSLKENMNTYKKLSIEAVNSSYVKNSAGTFNMLMETVEEWGNTSCVQIALATGNKEFLSEQPLVDLQGRLWCAQPLAAEIIDEDRGTKGALHRLCTKIRSPKVLFYINFVLYLAFHIMYGIQLLYFLKASRFGILEYLPPFWVLTLTLQLIQRAFPFNRHVLDIYFGIDIFCALFFYVAIALRVAALLNQGNDALMNAARVFYSLDYIAFSLRLFKFFYANQYLGPITATLFAMFWTLMRFLAIIGVFLLGCMVATESVMYPEAQFNIVQLYTLFRKPYWSMFGEFFLGEIEGTDNICNNNFNDDRCVSPVGQYYGPIILAAFVLVVNLLIFSLIIAKFNSNITYIEEKSVEIWRHQMFKLTMEYHRIIFLQPPLLLLCVVFGVFRYREENRKREESQVAYLQKFEQDVVLYLKQQIDDGRFFKRLGEYKQVGKIDLNIKLGSVQKTAEEFYTNFAKEMRQFEDLKALQKGTKEDLLKINERIENLQKIINDVPSKLETLVTQSKKDNSSLSKEDMQAMLQQSERATTEKVSSVMSGFEQALSAISKTTTHILNKERKFDEVK